MKDGEAASFTAAQAANDAGAGTDGERAGFAHHRAPFEARVDTDWSRVLYCDLYIAGLGEPPARRPAASPRIAMPARRSLRPRRLRTQLRLAVKMVCIYVGIAMAVAVAAQVLPRIGAPATVPAGTGGTQVGSVAGKQG